MSNAPTQKWLKARANMISGLETMLAFDFGVTGKELDGWVNWILDEVVRPEFEQALGIAPPELWSVTTLDEDGKANIVQSDMSRAEAAELCIRLEQSERRKHFIQKQ